MASTHGTWLDRAAGLLAPQWQLRRIRARIASEVLHRHYEAASSGRRTQGWKRSSSDANAATGPFVGRLRDVARDLVRNNAHAETGLGALVDHVVGWGIVAKPVPMNKRARSVWNAWAGTTACDADGMNDFAGLQKLVMRTAVESGEVLVRRRLRRPEDGLPIPLQIQVIEPDYIDTSKHGITLPNGGRIAYGVEVDAIGRRVAYWLFPEHPGNAAFPTSMSSQRVPATGIRHVFKIRRAGQARGASEFAPTLVRFKDFDEYEDATLVKQKIAACLAVITSDVDGAAAPLGTADDTDSPGIDSLEPGMVMNVPPGRSIEVVQPPSVREYSDYSKTSLRAIASALGVTYEDLTGDYSDFNFSSARMSRLRMWARVDDWRWRVLIPQFCGPVFAWAMEAAEIMGVPPPEAVRWTAPPMPMIEPDKEGLAYQRNVRTGIMTLSEAIRERGYDPDEVFEEMAEDYKRIDKFGLVLDSDPRKMTQAGQAQSVGGSPAAATATPTTETTDDDDDGETNEPEA